jgi:hypothetical protein
MPRLEELECYLRGIWLLLLGKNDGFGWLDISERGFWRSWWAIYFCLPPMVLSWVAFRATYLASMPEGARIGVDFFFRLGLVDLSGWLVPTLVMALVASLIGLRDRVIALVIITNWLSVPLQWTYALDNILQLLVPGSEALVALFFLALLSLSLMAHYQLITLVSGGRRLESAMLVLVLFVTSFYTQYRLLGIMGIDPAS